MILANVSFLIRMSSNATFYSETNEPLEEFREGIVYYWPKTQQEEGKPPLRGTIDADSQRAATRWTCGCSRTWRIRQQLSLETAATCYRWRWENEGFFRTYKRTLKKVDADEPDVAAGASRGGSLDDRHAVVALPRCVGHAAPRRRTPSGDVQPSGRAVGGASRHLGTQGIHEPFSERIARAQREQRVRTSAKQKREWPRRKPHTAPHPPILLRLTDEQKIKIQKHLQAA